MFLDSDFFVLGFLFPSIGNSKAALDQVVFFGHQFVHTWRTREVLDVNSSIVWYDQFLRTHRFSSSSFPHFVVQNSKVTAVFCVQGAVRNCTECKAGPG